MKVDFACNLIRQCSLNASRKRVGAGVCEMSVQFGASSHVSYVFSEIVLHNIYFIVLHFSCSSSGPEKASSEQDGMSKIGIFSTFYPKCHLIE